jgi:hypothetical protein
MKKYTEAEIEWLRQNRANLFGSNLADEFCKAFGWKPSTEGLKQTCLRHGIKCTVTGFLPGHNTWNKGKKGDGITGFSSTRFKPGNIPPKITPIGHERVIKGYVQIKAPNGKYMQKQRLIWEQHKGPIPSSHTVVFLDEDKTNFDITNLALVSRGELGKLNRHEKWSGQDVEIKKSLIALVRLELAAKGKK